MFQDSNIDNMFFYSSTVSKLSKKITIKLVQFEESNKWKRDRKMVDSYNKYFLSRLSVLCFNFYIEKKYFNTK